MADASTQLDPTRPLLAFDRTEQVDIPKRPPGKKSPFKPVKRPKFDRQGRRVAPQFRALQTAMAGEAVTLTDATEATDPEHIVVFEVVGSVIGFIRATEKVDGLNFVADLVGDGYDPDEDFYYEDDDGDVDDRRLPQTLYLVMANAQAITELIRLFELYQEHEGDVKFDTGLNPLKEVFSLLHTIRRWGPRDRVEETGLMDQWRESVAVRGASGIERVEIELVWMPTHEARAAVQERVEQLVLGIPNAKVLAGSAIPAIQYHAVLAELPPTFVDELLRDGPAAVELLTTDDVVFLASASPMTMAVAEAEPTEFQVDARMPTGAPTVALLDGMPIANHDVLDGRVIVHDPEGRGEGYSTSRCGHGTAMASLIVHGDLTSPDDALASPLYIEPILEPHEFFQHVETTPVAELFVDVVHAAIQRLLDDDNPLAASIRIINLSIGEPARAFTRRMSPLARLLDYLMATHNVLVIVSAGNHPAHRAHEAGPKLTARSDALADPTKLDAEMRRTLARESRQRGLLAPAESINALTVGATQDDQSVISLPDHILEPTAQGSVAAYSPSGYGFKRSPKPDLHMPGGRLVTVRPVSGDDGGAQVLEPAASGATGPGLLVAAPTRVSGVNGSAFSYGTSNAAALTTHYGARALDEISSMQDVDGDLVFPDPQSHAVLTKTLLVHATSWPAAAEGWSSDLGAEGTRRRRALTQHLGFGVLDTSRLARATSTRATVIGVGQIGNGKRRSFRYPLPPSLSSYVGWRRLTVTLCWFSPIAPRTQQYRIAHLKFGSPREELRVEPGEVDHNANGNGTVLHEVLEGNRAAGYVADDVLAIDVDCRVRVGRLYGPVRFGLAVTLEVGQNVRIDVHGEIRDRLRTKVQAERIRPTARG